MMTILIVYIDDLILTSNDEIEMERLKRNLAADFEIKDLGPLKYFLGMEVARSKKEIVVSQRKDVLHLLQETSLSGCKPTETLMDQNAKLWEKGDTPIDTGRYQRLV